MSYLPFVSDFNRNQRPTLSRYVSTYVSGKPYDTTNATDLEHYPNFSSRKPSKNRFEVYLDVEHYMPQDIRVKKVKGFVIVEGQHKEKKDEYGWVKRQFCRRCPLPEGYKTEILLSQYSADGTLILTGTLVKSDAESEMPVGKRQKGEAVPAEENQGDSTTGDDENLSEMEPVASTPPEEMVIGLEVVAKNAAQLDDAEQAQVEEVPSESEKKEE